MNNSILKSSKIVDVNRLIAATFKVEQMVGWSINNQIAITCRETDVCHGASTQQIAHGAATLRSVENNKMVRDDTWFDYFVPGFEHTYLYELWKELTDEYGKVFRMRLMKLEHKACLSFHQDFYKRYHIPIITNDASFFFINESDEPPVVADDNRVPSMATYHLPANGDMYLVDTTKHHTVYNGGGSDRIHLVFSV